MGDSIQAVALPDIRAGDAAAVAAQLSNWLIARGIVKEGAIAAPPGVKGFNPDPRAAEVLASKESGWHDVAFKEVHVCSTRRVSTAVQGGLGPVSCPTCENALGDSASMPLAFTRAVDEWHSGEEGMLFCPACKSSAPITKWRTEPYWAFGDVTVTFWNWPRLGETFVSDLAAASGHEAKVVRGKI